MKRLLILGGGTAGTMIANRLRPRLDANEWKVTIVDQDATHYYQPGFLFIPFGIYQPEDVVKPKKRYINEDVEMILGEVDRVEPEENLVRLTTGQTIDYEYLVIATGTTPRPEETPGLPDEEWYESIFDFYTYEGSVALAEKLANWEGGRLVINIMEMPIKCPVAPLEFAFLADWYFTEKGMRDKVEITYATPLPDAFTKPVAAKVLGNTLKEKNIKLAAEFYPEHVDAETKELVAYDETTLPFDLLVTVPVNMGADFVDRSGLGDELNHVPVNKHTFLSLEHENIFALGDAAALPTSKAGSVAHFSVELFEENFLNYINGLPLEPTFDGHANCFVETGFEKAILIDFNYDVQPLPGRFPYARVGPMSLLKESRLNHWGKLAFKWVYWNMLLPGRPLPVPALMSMEGKVPAGELTPA